MLYSPSTPYLFVEIWVPKRAPYNSEAHGWPSILGDVVKPLVEAHHDLCWWALQEGPHWQLCLASQNLRQTEAVMKRIMRERGFCIKRYIRGSTLGGALGGSRWLPVRKQGSAAETHRSFLLTQACHAVSAVYLDTLVQKGRDKARHWEVEAPQCTKQNPHGNLFESFMHLVANLSGAEFDVMLQVRTRWMHDGWKDAKVTCHL